LFENGTVLASFSGNEIHQLQINGAGCEIGHRAGIDDGALRRTEPPDANP
jgi:hypothetical protein